MGQWVALNCEAATLQLLASGLTHHGPADGEPQWLVSGVWLCTADKHFLATASGEVLRDGHVARRLNIQSPESVLDSLATDLPDVEARLSTRGSGIDLGPPPSSLPPPASLHSWPAGSYATQVLVRVSRHASTVNRVASGLLFTAQSGDSLLVGTDVASLAMVYSQEPTLIGRFQAGCETHSIAEYLKLAAR